MATIRCPGCGRTEKVFGIEGRYLVKCGECQQEFVAYILKHKPLMPVDLACPQCNAAESFLFSGPGTLKVTCGKCGREFLFSKNKDSC
ncbi:MAG TPA: hypothetical protein GX528_07985 [Firmicutes bacterium]|nr:hypothetical protein [Bacillota bacterium]